MAYRISSICLNSLAKTFSQPPLLPYNNPYTCLQLLIAPRGSEKTLISSSCIIQRAWFSLWSMRKDAALENVLKRNRRWTINNQLKNILQRCPEQTASIDFLQKKFNNLDIRKGSVLNWLKKYPCFFEIYTNNFLTYAKLTKRMRLLIEEEEIVKEQQEPALAERLAKILMLTPRRKLNVEKFNDLRKSFGLPDDYLLTVVPKRADLFSVSDYNGRKNSLEIQLVSWNPSLAVSAVERKVQNAGEEPKFENWLPEGFENDSLVERFNRFQEIPYFSPYESGECLEEGSEELEKRRVGVFHELLSLTLWKRASIAKLSKFQREFGLAENLVAFLMRHPAIFYVSNQNDMHTVLLREGYVEGELVEKDPLVAVKEKFGELMQEGLYEYTERRRKVNLEKRKANRPLWKMNNDIKALGRELFKPSCVSEEGREERYQKEARERFQRVASDSNTR